MRLPRMATRRWMIAGPGWSGLAIRRLRAFDAEAVAFRLYESLHAPESD